MQLTRVIRSGGISLLILSPLLVLAIFFVVKTLTDKGVLYISIIACVTVCLIDGLRKDKDFLFLLKRNGFFLRFAEYVIILISYNAYAFVIYREAPLYFLADTIFLAGVVMLNKSNKYRLRENNIIKTLSSVLPKNAYELKYSFRQLAPVVIPIWVLSLIASFYAPVVPLAILLMCILILEHISYREPIEITQSYNEVSRALQGKISLLAKIIFILFTPHIIITCLLWYSLIVLAAVLGAFWIAISAIAYALLLRYSSRSGAYSSMVIGVRLVLFLVVSPLVPLSIYLLYKQYKIAKWNLTPLLK